MRNTLMIALLLVSVLVSVPASVAGERVIADDGREVMLGDDGRWEWASDDRFATTASGERVRLRSDGVWEIVSGSAAVRPMPVQSVVNTGPASWSLGDVTIETARGQRSATKKNVNKQTQTVFNLQARMRTQESGAEQWTLDASDIRVIDSGGREYPVVSTTPDNFTLPSDAPAKMVVRVDGSPHWFTTRYFEVRIAEQSVGNAEEIRLKRALSNVQKSEVDALPQ
ncbi:MAG: hypothetical protein ACI9NT_001947 [Bacteroidia bacterium]|jgi:hypothetical protein